MIRYTGRRKADGSCEVRRIGADGKNQIMKSRRISGINHSPTGFEWGYAGSGPAQLALALLYDATGGDGDRSVRLHQGFKFAVIAKLDRDAEWELTDEDVLREAVRLEERRKAEVCTYPRCRCIVQTSTTSPEPTCPMGLRKAEATS